MTIEERAKEYCHREKVENVDCLHAYTIGATEQKAIDDAERDTAVYNLLMLKLDAEKKLWLDKACEWLKINYGHFDGSIEDLVADFRKAMEE